MFNLPHFVNELRDTFVGFAARSGPLNGYDFSSPLDLFFDEQTVNRFLDRVEKGGGA